ncbi:MAG: hypothetical protein EAZ42_12405 [Verrucomicrobia bacterium]|nr:MAG: hypothetical protein EAZ42_12405 [Verrucomicrobiota bacterium]
MILIYKRAMPQFRANTDYEDTDPEPLFLHAGDVVCRGIEDKTWPGWVWAVSDDGHSGYVPWEMLEETADGKLLAIETYDPRVLTIRRNDLLDSLRHIHGWHWCRNQAGEEGWIAAYLLSPVP